jgi:hypothetical protein
LYVDGRKRRRGRHSGVVFVGRLLITSKLLRRIL